MRQVSRAIIIKDDKILLMERNKFGLKYRALIGGGINSGESALDALHREVFEEASIRIKNPRLVITEDAGEIYGTQYIFLADFDSGEVKLSPDSEEYGITAMGKNIYNPVWYPIKDLNEAHILPVELNDILIEFTTKGFPKEPIQLKIDVTNII